jgi:hypothetical protein
VVFFALALGSWSVVQLAGSSAPQPQPQAYASGRPVDAMSGGFRGGQGGMPASGHGGPNGSPYGGANGHGEGPCNGGILAIIPVLAKFLAAFIAVIILRWAIGLARCKPAPAGVSGPAGTGDGSEAD